MNSQRENQGDAHQRAIRLDSNPMHGRSGENGCLLEVDVGVKQDLFTESEGRLVLVSQGHANK